MRFTRPLVTRRATRLPFDQRLVLNRWLLSLFEVASFDDLAQALDDPTLAGFDEDNVWRFHSALALRLVDREHFGDPGSRLTRSSSPTRRCTSWHGAMAR